MPYSRAPGLRLRPVPELGKCLAFTPAPPRLHTLNPAAWLILELCADPAADLEAEFLGRSAPALAPDDAHRQLRAGLDRLQASGLIHWHEPEETAP